MPIPSGLVLQKNSKLTHFFKIVPMDCFFRSYVYNVNNKVTALNSYIISNATTLY